MFFPCSFAFLYLICSFTFVIFKILQGPWNNSTFKYLLVNPV